ncbi:MAG: hypothetical protein UR52_C0002G0106 [Candidatus Gottesmanbacteria bacterium GW2011_GWA1_34_13]|uniref:Uncharacterized protein n=1 Tax=Candidatus Gottesmanbacteria bacterium GW2011_GWA1_34_13 TaxID=1618434 RepID=A0A0G0AS48_9BACT|nr:MAG: hypothetical protein UR52_C0002G0106 [Candidatus Gottesmanbacteria bacterium GW2011_GWA1_34_13]
MFKTRLTQNKETVIAIILSVGLVILIVINLWTLIPTIWTAFTQQEKTNLKQPIDIESVNQAIEIINNTISK